MKASKNNNLSYAPLDSAKLFPYSPIDLIKKLMGYDTPILSRATYRLEMLAIVFSSLGMAVAVGEYCSFLAKRGFGAQDILISTIIAAPPIGSMISSLLADKLRYFKQAAVAGGSRIAGGILIAAIAALPRGNEISPWIFTALTLLIASAMMVGTHARTEIWKSNYPKIGKGLIVGRILIIQLALTAICAKIAGNLFDLFDQKDTYSNMYRWIYLLAGLMWAISGILFCKIPVRGDKKRISEQRPSKSQNPLSVLGVLVTDKQFARYQVLQMLQGMSCLMLGPVMTLILTEQFNADYSSAAQVIVTIPFVVQVLLIMPLGKLFDKMSVFRFRFYGSMFWAISRFVVIIALWLKAIPVLMAAYVFQGVGQSYGRLAWSMGHMEFGTPRQNLTYMSAHMMLAGFRGIVMPFLGVYMYREIGSAVVWISAIILAGVSITFRIISPANGQKAKQATDSNTNE